VNGKKKMMAGRTKRYEGEELIFSRRPQNASHILYPFDAFIFVKIPLSMQDPDPK
jgi:hypothetical protein